MTIKGKMILVLSLALLVIFILRDSGHLDLHFYRSLISSSTSSKWSFTVDAVNMPMRERGQKLCPGDAGLKDVPILVHCMGYKQGENGTDDCLPVSVFINHVDHGPLWIPLYKNTAFHCNIPLHRALATYRQQGDSLQLHNYLISGTITLNGNLTITGFCSYPEAERLLAKHLMSTVYNTVREQLDKQQIHKD